MTDRFNVAVTTALNESLLVRSKTETGDEEVDFVKVKGAVDSGNAAEAFVTIAVEGLVTVVATWDAMRLTEVIAGEVSTEGVVEDLIEEMIVGVLTETEDAVASRDEEETLAPTEMDLPWLNALAYSCSPEPRRFQIHPRTKILQSHDQTRSAMQCLSMLGNPLPSKRREKTKQGRPL